MEKSLSHNREDWLPYHLPAEWLMNATVNLESLSVSKSDTSEKTPSKIPKSSSSLMVSY